jgi:aspartyl-tRNA(Asn)/glutamyl-tRNA(Gln) amidotransferase subunit C
MALPALAAFCLLRTRFRWHRRRMAVPDIDVKHVAHLARLRLTPEEEARFGGQLGHVIEYVSKLQELDVRGVEPTAHAMPLVNVTRPDEVRPSLPREESLRNAPAQAGGLFVVPKIVE